MKKASAITAVIVLTLVSGIWTWINVQQLLPALAFIALIAICALGLLWRHRIFTLAGISAAWAFCIPSCSHFFKFR